MGHRNIICTSQMTDLEPHQQRQTHLRSEHCVLFGNVANSPQPNIHTISPGNPANLDIHHQPVIHENALFYGVTPYNGFQHHYHPARNLDVGVATTSNYYNPHVNLFGPLAFPLPIPINQGSHDQLPSSSNGVIFGVPFKRKSAEGIAGSSSIAPSNTSFPIPEYRGNNIPSVMEVGSHRSARNSNHLIQANYPGQAFQNGSSPWLDQQFRSNGGDGGNLTWSQAPAITYLHGSGSVNSVCTEAGNMGAHWYQDTSSNRSSTAFMHLPPIYQGYHNLRHLPQPMHGVRGQNANFHSQVATPSHRVSMNSTSHINMNPFRDGMEVGPRYAGPVPPTGLRIHRPHQSALLPEATVRHPDLPHLRFLPADEVAMLEISGYYEVGNSIDDHRDVRLDIDHMSYEELLALGERIGNVTTGLSEEAVFSHLKTRTHTSSTTMNLEEAAREDREADFCVICQTDYKKQEKIGTLDCGHEYHVDCVKRWLLIKNTCPICKSSALTEG